MPRWPELLTAFRKPLLAPEDHLDANVYYRELGMQLSREVSLGDTIYTEK